ncbi:MAG TPA: AI-2E family transporter, partial [Stellaceae bacterium]|nr:AI-2E family transporter [Stellaceae bacterium]
MLDAVHPPEPSAPAPPQVPPARTPGAQGLAIIVAVVIVAALYYGREVLMPVTLAVLLSFVLSPLVELLRRVWLGRILSVALAVVLALAIILGLGTAIGTQVAQLAKNVPQYQTTIERKIATLRDVTVKKLSDTIQSVSHEFAPAQKPAETAPAAAGGGMQTQEQKPVPVVVTEPGLSALQIGEKVLTPILNPLATTGIILVVTIFTLLQKEDLRDRAIRLFGSSDLERTTVALDDAARRLSRYFLTQLGMNTGFGVIVAVGLYFIGVPNPVLWGVLGALLRFIPYIGSWIAALLPIALAAAVAPGWSMAIWTAALYIVTEVTLGQAVEPLVYGHTTGLSPIAVIIAAIFWTWVWGPIGLIISTPLTLCLVLLGRYVEHLEFLDVLLGDRPALTPVESFYQRLLAGDPDAVEEQAERHLNDLPLSSYYDEVALKGLQLAAIDVARGALNASKVDTLKEAIKELVAELDAYEDDEPTEAEERQTVAGPTADQKGLPKASPPAGADRGDLPPEWQGEAPVLCIAGRGPLDEAASAMLAQLLGKHGLGARTVPHDAVSRSHIAGLDTGGVAMVCVSYLDISGNPAHL